MLSKIISSAVVGVDAYQIEVEVDVASGLPIFNIVGLPEIAVKESKDRVKSAIKNSGYPFSSDRITINLAPADIKKEGTGLDLPIAIGILAATGIVSEQFLTDYILLGELSLDGTLRPIKGILPATTMAEKSGYKGIILPKENCLEGAVVEGINVLPVNHLSEVVAFLNSEKNILPVFKKFSEISLSENQHTVDFSEVIGQEHVRRAIEISASGFHNILMIGPPGSGKTMIARRIPTILPALSLSESLETTKIYSVSGKLETGKSLIIERPFRSPHHTISDAGLIGGGHIPKPGEVSLAHNGLLFLDEFPEFKKNVLEVLRQPLEDCHVTISRAATAITYPSSFMLVAAMNPCPCGYFGDERNECRCSGVQINRYRSKISGPLLDRIDIHVDVPAVPYKELMGETSGETSSEIRKRVEKARRIQAKRFSRSQINFNARMGSRHLKKYCKLDGDSSKILEQAIDKFGFSARTYTRILKISRTIADLDESEHIHSSHLAEAIQYRTLDRKGFIR